MKPYAETTTGLSTFDCLDQIRMSPAERLMAKAYLRKAELLAETLMRVGADLRHVFGFVGRGLGDAVRRRKVSAETPERHEWNLP